MLSTSAPAKYVTHHPHGRRILVGRVMMRRRMKMIMRRRKRMLLKIRDFS